MPLEEALARLAEGAQAARIRETVTLSTFDALGRVLAADVNSTTPRWMVMPCVWPM
jgi:molybdopterin molybdotransferase